MGTDLTELAHKLSNGGEAFALATVVWRRGPSSAKEGYKALITEDGAVTGWVAGACTEPLMVRQALKAMKDGKPRLMLIGAPEDIDTRSRDGLLTFAQTCQSEGALEVFVEPVLPSPHLVIIGRSPVVDVMSAIGKAVGWRTVIVDDEGGSGSDHLSADKVVNSLDLAEAGVNSRSFVVVATQGHYDEDAVEKALQTDAAYVGLVASRKRAAAVLDYLREAGVSEDDLKRVHAPAGLDLGRVVHEEIAIGVIGEIVKLKAAGELGVPGAAGAVHQQHTESSQRHEHAHEHEPDGRASAHEGHGHRHEAHVHPDGETKAAEAQAAGGVKAEDTEPGQSRPAAGSAEPEEAIDPVCGMTVDVATARYRSEYNGQTYYFCCPACRKTFEKSPAEYAGVKLEA